MNPINRCEAERSLPPAILGAALGARLGASLSAVLVGLLTLTAITMMVTTAPAAEAAEAASTPVTTTDPELPTEVLSLLLDPLTRDELAIEAAGWRALLRELTEELSAVHIAVIEAHAEAEEIKAVADEAAEAGREQQAAADEAVAEAVDEEKSELVTDVTELMDRRHGLIKRVELVLAAWRDKGGDEAEIAEYEQYVAAVGGISLQVKDSATLKTLVVGWFKSESGGILLAKRLGTFAIILIIAMLLARLLAHFTRKALARTANISVLMKDFITRSVGRVIIFVGLIVAVSALGVNIGPLMAVIGAAGFVVAFALQDSLSNFAAGIMIMVYKPFDVGDLVDAATVMGKVKTMNLVSTVIKTLDNKLVIVPNSSIWGSVITNVTGSVTRRVDLIFGIGYSDDIAQAQEIMERILKDHPQVLDDPEPMVRLHELGDSSVNFICRPWVKTDDYWDVHWDVTRAVKEAFDSEGVSIPFPQRDVHFYPESGDVKVEALPAPARSGNYAATGAMDRDDHDMQDADDGDDN